MRLRSGLALLAFAAAFGAGFALVRGIAPERVRSEIEARLADALGGPVAIGRLRIAPGFGLRLHAEAVTAWPSEAGPRLRVEQVDARLRPLALLGGGPIFGTLRLDGVSLALERDRSGGWQPPPLARVAGSREQAAPEPPPPAQPAEAWLEPVAALDSLARAVLGGSGLADAVEVHRARIAFRDAASPSGDRVALEMEGLEARLRRHRILGGVDLFLRGRLLEAGGTERGTVEILGSRSRDGTVQMALATTALDLATIAPYLPREQPQRPIAGTVSGYLGSQSPAPGQTALEMDLVISNLRSVIPGFDTGEARPVAIERIDLAGFLDVAPDHLKLRELRFENGGLRLELAGRISRPLASASLAKLSLALRDLDVDELRELLSWLPELRREQATRALERIEAGLLANLQVDGSARLSRWQDFLSGRERELPERFSLQADVAGARLRVGDSDHLDQLSGQLAWSGDDHLEVKGARALFEGAPLPVLDLSLAGVSNFLAGDPERRRLAPGGEPLPGLEALADVLAGEPDPESRPLETRIRIEAEAIDHPALLWPVEGLAAAIELEPDVVRVEELRGAWAGVPISGRAEFAEQPERTARVELVAGPPESAPPRAGTGEGWARGRFEVERLATRIWNHERASGRFNARGARFDFEDVEAALAPSGRIFGRASLDLAHTGSVPYRASFRLEQAEVPGVADAVGLPRDFATGRIELAGSFEGSLAHKVPASLGLTGLLSLRARDGEIRRVLPAVVAIALASRSFNPFTGREQIRYDRAETVIEFADGRMHTEALSIDGPDLRIFASGDLSLASPAHPVDAHVVLFLFRQIDNVIGRIPVLNLLLGPNENLLAAYFNLTGPWAEPEATLVPLRSLASGPASLVVEGVPFWVRRGLQAIGAIDADAVGAPARAFSPEPPPRKDS
jgi:hypothetical protein